HSGPRNAALQAGTLQREQRLQIGQGRLSTFIGVQTAGPETVVTAGGGEVIDRKALVVPPQEPLEGTHRLMAVLTTTRVGRPLDQRLNESGRVNGLFVTFFTPTTSRLIGPAPAVAHQADGVAIDRALVRVPVESLDPSLRDLVV